MKKATRVMGKVHPSNDPKAKKTAQPANRGKPTSNKNVKPLTKNQRYSGTT